MISTKLRIDLGGVERGKAMRNQIGDAHPAALHVIKEQTDHFPGAPG